MHRNITHCGQTTCDIKQKINESITMYKIDINKNETDTLTASLTLPKLLTHELDIKGKINQPLELILSIFLSHVSSDCKITIVYKITYTSLKRYF